MNLSYEPSVGENIRETAAEMVNMANAAGQTVTAKFNDVEIEANPGDSADTIADHYSAECVRRHEEWKQSLAGQEAAREQEEYRKRAATAEAEGILPFTLADPEAWAKIVAANRYGYGACAVRYAARWAHLMESCIESGTPLNECADAMSHVADSEGIPGFRCGCAVGILAKAWERGEELRRWHKLWLDTDRSRGRARERYGRNAQPGAPQHRLNDLGADEAGRPFLVARIEELTARLDALASRPALVAHVAAAEARIATLESDLATLRAACDRMLLRFGDEYAGRLADVRLLVAPEEAPDGK